jgi:two-component sensor histidine kinase
MKTISVFFTLLFVFSGLSSFSQEQVIKLKMEEGHEYIFEKVDKIYGIWEDESKDFRSVKTKEIRITVEKVIPGEEIQLTLQYLKSRNETRTGFGILSLTDYFFPNLNEGETEYPDLVNFIEYLLCRSKLSFSLNLKTNEIKLLNRVELLEQFHARLNEQQFSSDVISGYINAINQKKFFVQPDLITFLTWFNNAELKADQTLTNTGIDEQFIVRERKGEFLNFGDVDFDKIIPGKKHKKYWINLENGIVTNYTTIQFDSIRARIDRVYNNFKWEVNETGFRMLYSQKIPENKLFVSGKIEKPLSNKVHIRILDDPFDVILKTKTVLLDEKGSFTTNLDYSHAGFVYVENENNNKHNPPGTYVFYAEPGDTIHFESTGIVLPWQTTVSGNRTVEAKLLQEMREKIKPGEFTRMLPSRSQLLFDEEIISIFGIVDGKIVQEAKVGPLIEALATSKDICLKYKPVLSDKAYNFIVNEVHAFFYNGIFDIGWMISANRRFEAEISADLKDLERINQIDIHTVYNDYGLHSRQSIYKYLKFQFSQANKIKYQYYTGPMSWSSSPEPEMELQFARMVLTGSPFYREIGKTLTRILEQKSQVATAKIRTDYLNDFVMKYLDLILRKCNDIEVTEKVTQIVSQYKKLETGNFVPELDLVDINNKKVSYKDFLNGKPTIIYYTENWIGERYGYEEAAKQIPELNYVMVVEGSNFKQWEEYTKSANPTMTHLLFINDSVTFRDIFQAQQVHMVFNKEGEYIGKARNAKQALKLAQDSLIPQKKELNKSQLKLIILTLGILILIALVVFAIWKWRVRQRFRREQQQRRLRELELTAIRSQMNPHFLFNSLNSVQNLVQQNKGREAHLYLSDFAGLIRKVLQNSEKEEVSLAEELEMTEQYLNLEKLRFDFDFTIGVEQGIDIHNTTVPSMLLQPFAENAVIHGLQNKPENRRLKIEVLKKGGGGGRGKEKGRGQGQGGGEDKGIVISIEDNGIGREAAAAISKTKNGKGSKLIQERLEILQEKQGEKYSLKTIDLEEGTRVEIFIPEEN